jgi:hypothetical protein
MTPRIVNADSAAVFASPDHMLFTRQGTLFAQPFDTRRGVLAGNPFALASRLRRERLRSHIGFDKRDAGVSNRVAATALSSRGSIERDNRRSFRTTWPVPQSRTVTDGNRLALEVTDAQGRRIYGWAKSVGVSCRA